MRRDEQLGRGHKRRAGITLEHLRLTVAELRPALLGGLGLAPSIHGLA